MLVPLAKRILLKPIEIKHGPLVLPIQKSSQYLVIAIGDEVTKVLAGDVIYLEKYYCYHLEHDGDEYLIIDESSIIAKVVNHVR